MTLVKNNVQALFNFLESHKLRPGIEEKSGQLYCGLASNGVEIAVLFMPSADKHLLQILLYLPIRYPVEKKEEVARLLHKINHMLDLPGFGMEETSHTIFVRHVQVLSNEQIDGNMLLSLLKILTTMVGKFYDMIDTVCKGEKTVDDLGLR